MVIRNKKPLRPELTKVLYELCKYVPSVGGVIDIKVEDAEENRGKFFSIMLPPSMFMACYPPYNPNMKIEKREFWNKDCHEYIASLDIREHITVVTTLFDNLPRDAKYLSERR